jgi:hypothetical protein
MKVKIGKCPSWIGPYQIAEKILFWKDRHDDAVYELGRRLSGEEDSPTLLRKLCLWIDSKRKQTIKIHIDPWDTWSADHTLALIIVPILQQLRERAHGAPLVDDEDVPYNLRSINAKPKENPWDIDDNHFKRWDWVLGEMIAAFEIVRDQWDLEMDDATRGRRDNGLRLFGKYYLGLWD